MTICDAWMREGKGGSGSMRPETMLGCLGQEVRING